MKVAVIIVCAFQIVAGYSNCPKYYNIDTNIENYYYKNIEDYGLVHVSRDEVTFRLWTRDQTNVFVPLYYGHLRDEDSFRPKNPFKIIIHGWTDCADSEWYAYLKDEYLKKGDYNVILVDWSKPASALYPLSAGYTKDVGKFVGEFLMDLNSSVGVPYENMHVIGHSLGAHISGFAGKTVTKNTRKTIGRITGLDPAGPLFLLASASGRLSSEDALFVDVIHTDGGKFGYLNHLGKIDFYPNGGKAPQPGCVLYEDIIDVASCSHTRSYYLFGESINSEGFIGRECSSIKNYKRGACNDNPYSTMGDNNELLEKGNFYLTTNTNTPFANNGRI